MFIKTSKSRSVSIPGLLMATLYCGSLWAQAPAQTQVTRSIQILPVPPFDMVSDLALGGQVTPTPETVDTNVKINLIVGCFARNLRSVRNPLSPDAEIKMDLGLGPTPGLPVQITFPAYLVKGGKGFGSNPTALVGSFNAASDYDLDPGFAGSTIPIYIVPPPNNATSAVAYGNVIEIRTNIPVSTVVSFNAQGGFPPSAKNNAIAYLNFIQNIVANTPAGNPGGRKCMNEVEDEKKTLRQSVAGWINSNLFPAAQAGGDGAYPAGVDGGGDGSSTNFHNWTKDIFLGNPHKVWVPQVLGPATPHNAKCEHRVKLPRPGKKAAKDSNKYIGLDGPMNFQVLSAWSANFSTLDLFVSFPGERKFCGGYVSPLMLFADGKRPTFTGQSSMMNRPDPGVSAWVEPNAPGVFLALDRNNNGKIDDATELFGEDELAANGFAKLAQYDENHDNLINAKDPIFKRLLYFNDKNGNGQSEEGELSSAADSGLMTIDLKYSTPTTHSYGKGLVKAREQSNFIFRDPKTKRISNGEIVDIWFGRK